jgi:hypothetical protein
MPDEVNYEAQLLSFEQAQNCLGGPQRFILEFGWQVYQNKLEIEEFLAKEAKERADSPAHNDER